MRIKMNRKTKRILSLVVGCLLAVGAIALIVNLVKTKNEDELKEIHPTFEVGGLDENGDFVDTKESLYTKKAIEYNDLKVSIDFDANIQYQLFYYDEDDKFVSTSEVFTKGHTETSEETKYVRVLITPVYADDVEDEDKVVKWYEIAKYANQLTIERMIYEVEVTTTINLNNKPIEITFERGMTWEEWVKSDFNNLGIYIDAETNLVNYTTLLEDDDEFTYYVEVDGVNVDPGDKISLDLSYRFNA